MDDRQRTDREGPIHRAIYTLQLPWPDKALSSNARGKHWAKKHRATKAARDAAFWAAKEHRVIASPSAKLTFRYFPPNNRRRDAQNMPHALKAYIDGIAAAMGCDDHGFRVVYPSTFASVAPGGMVHCQIECNIDESRARFATLELRGIIT